MSWWWINSLQLTLWAKLTAVSSKTAEGTMTSNWLSKLFPLCNICRVKGIKVAAKVNTRPWMKKDSLGNPGYFRKKSKKDLGKSKQIMCVRGVDLLCSIYRLPFIVLADRQSQLHLCVKARLCLSMSASPVLYCTPPSASTQ